MINRIPTKPTHSTGSLGGVTLEFFLVLTILIIFLNYLFDIAQRIGQFSWLQQSTYLAAKLGSETNAQSRGFIQKKLMFSSSQGYPASPQGNQTSFVEIQNSFWKLKPFQESTVDSTFRSYDESFDFLKVIGKSSRAWRPSVLDSNTFDLTYSSFINTSATLTGDYALPANLEIEKSPAKQTLRYDWCGRICGNNYPCPNPNDAGYYLNGISGEQPLIAACR